MQSRQAVNFEPSDSGTGKRFSLSIRHTVLCGKPMQFEICLVLSPGLH